MLDHLDLRMNRGCRPIIGRFLVVVLLGVGCKTAYAKTPNWKAYAARSDAWYRGEEGKRVAANVLSQQSPRGSWPKNFDTSEAPFAGDRSTIKGTFDNGATVGEVRFLARAYRATNEANDKNAVIKAVDHVLEAQYPSGGWPQSYPPGKDYPRYITFNDNTMVNLMQLLRDVAKSPDFDFVDDGRRTRSGRAFGAGVDCILKSQIRIHGVKTVWCAQHDEKTLEPRPARKFEPASLSGAESAGILTLLMSLEDPSPEVVEAVEAGVRWFDAVKLTGIRQVEVDGDKRVVPDDNAPPLWARFYEFGTNRPIFSGRDSVIKYNISEIEHERRNGYSWYGNWGTGLAQRYERWKARRAKSAQR